MRYSLHKHAQASLSSGINLRSAVQLPRGEDSNDWIAVHGMHHRNFIYVQSQLTLVISGGLLQPDQSHLRHRERPVLGRVVSDHVRRSQVRIPLGRRKQVQETDCTAGASIRGPADGLDRGAY